jgi:hypothetical protein
MSEPKERREAGLLTVVGLSHAEDVARRAKRGAADSCQATREKAIADDAAFTVLSSRILELDREAMEDGCRVLKSPILARRLCDLA